MPERTRKVHSFVVAYDDPERVKEEGCVFRFYKFNGLPMGPSSSPSAMQVSSGLMVVLSNEKTQNRLQGVSRAFPSRTRAPLQDAVESLSVEDEEVYGLEAPRSSKAALRYAEILEETKVTVLPRPSTDNIIVDAINDRRSHSATMFKEGMDRAKFMDDWVLGAETANQIRAMYEEDLETTTTFGHIIHPSKTKHNTDSSCAEGLGIIWEGSNDTIKAKSVDVDSLRDHVTRNGQITVRETLSYLHTAHDPFGIHGWITHGVKVILRQAFVSNKQMDDHLSVEDSRRVYELLDTYNSNISSRLTPRFIDTRRHLTVYTDASAIGLAVFITSSSVTQPLLCCDRLVPLHQCRFSIVRKEHLALELGLQLTAALLPDLPFSESRIVHVCVDSLIVVQRIQRALKILSSTEEVRPRVPKTWSRWEYLHSLSAARWLRAIAAALGDDPHTDNFQKVKLVHCPSANNLADPYTRGYDPQELDSETAQRWLTTLTEGGSTFPEGADPTRDVFTITESSEEASSLDLAESIYSWIVAKQQDDPLCRFIRYLKNDIEEAPEEIDIENFNAADRCKIKALYCINTEENQPVVRLQIGRDAESNNEGLLLVPPGARQKVLISFHCYSCHRNSKFQYAKMAEFYYWKGIRRDVRAFCRSCPACQQAKGHGSSVDEEVLLNSRVYLDANTVLSIDWIGPVNETNIRVDLPTEPKLEPTSHSFVPVRSRIN
ncbi:hypothetical protein Pmar_PMAR021839 [Perkinsus marinus ATCC 50983]|uniref:Integrase zinc-binding domain-containing protein n=1 Tax=Perkinsus marinus (strain ATCC 50983 / TXsc) TaxID=423536 RepID=C5LG77_PERM5|nr:hypothetical protein Pmar_PMAR021839 [Perkinsus marinus ATCC 50983]EER04332.1 hypothetical protein Pmar_PMAR021839 [Perkinsus marinus ATCC 50983]|eukprot:XP_002772516.1 hypothetical protein Pmar_PMAR021839 [Perkinsus marinus ATCC 50983]